MSYVELLIRTRVMDSGEVRLKRNYSSLTNTYGMGDSDVMAARYVYKGKEYVGLTELSRDTGIRESVLLGVLSEFEETDVTDLLATYETPKKTIRVFDREYFSVTELVDTFGIDRSAFNYQLRFNRTYEEALVIVLDKQFLGKPYDKKEYVFDGNSYGSIWELYENVEKSGSMTFPQFVFEMSEGSYFDVVSTRIRQEFEELIWKGDVYSSLRDLAKAVGAKQGVLKKRIRELGDVDAAVEALLAEGVKKKYKLNGEYFNTIREMEIHLGFSSAVFRKDILHSGIVWKLDIDGKYVRFYG